MLHRNRSPFDCRFEAAAAAVEPIFLNFSFLNSALI
jgi:hypothetical protein